MSEDIIRCGSYSGLKAWLSCEYSGKIISHIFGLSIFFLVPLWILGILGHALKWNPKKSVLIHMGLVFLLFAYSRMRVWGSLYLWKRGY
jgi:hypothetical protein